MLDKASMRLPCCETGRHEYLIYKIKRSHSMMDRANQFTAYYSCDGCTQEFIHTIVVNEGSKMHYEFPLRVVK